MNVTSPSPKSPIIVIMSALSTLWSAVTKDVCADWGDGVNVPIAAITTAVCHVPAIYGSWHSFFCKILV